MTDHATDYKTTLNLPATDFPMRANLAKREPDLQRFWADIDLYGKIRQQRQGAPKYLLHDGPPYANGEIHVGHVVNKVLKDIIVKSRGLSGLDAPYVPGWDCHGLPIEHVVEKRIGKVGDTVTAKQFRAACRSYAAEQVAAQSEGFQRLGVIGDWANPYLTMAYETEANIIRALGSIVEAGFVFKGEKPVHWCLDCASALAEAEVEHADRRSPSIDVKFPVAESEDLAQVFDGATVVAPSLVIWTTTPWTLPANQAVSLHPEYEYALLELTTGEQVIVAADLVESAQARWGIDGATELARCRGAALENIQLDHPFLDLRVPVILGDHVTLETGTGAVHTAPAHGHDDFVIGQRYNLAVYNPVTAGGLFEPGTPIFAGEQIFAANDHVIEVLRERGKLLQASTLEHSYPHCWRHKSPTIVRTTAQWFIGMEHGHLRENALQQIAKTQWTPEWGEARIHGMIAGRPDWCISRQRTWGVPIALFVHRESGELHPDTPRLLEKVAERVARDGIDAWFDLAPIELLGDDADRYDKVEDILDVWFDSGVTHATVLDQRDELGFPADLYLEGSDQHRGWFHSSLLTSVAMRGVAPYRGVLTHGFAVDAKGMKMSKSRGNVIAPDKVINRLGADILRLWVAATDYRAEMSVSDEILTRIADAYRRIRNTARYLLGNLAQFDPDQHLVPYENLLALDRWAVDKAAELDTSVREAYESFEFHQLYHSVHNFCAVDLGSFYLDVLKDRLYTCAADSAARRSAQTAMFHILHGLVRWLAPVLSFTAEEVWQRAPGKSAESVFLTTWYEFPQAIADGEFNTAFWDRVLMLRDKVSKALEALRETGTIGSSLDAEVDLYLDDNTLRLLERLKGELRFLLITSDARLHAASARHDDAVQVEEGVWLKVAASTQDKCIRCWHLRPDVGSDPAHPDICGRCVQNVAGPGESRLVA